MITCREPGSGFDELVLSELDGLVLLHDQTLKAERSEHPEGGSVRYRYWPPLKVSPYELAPAGLSSIFSWLTASRNSVWGSGIGLIWGNYT
jgi:hypothetical protein